MQNAKFKMHNCGIIFGDALELSAIADTLILHSAFFILHLQTEFVS